MGVYDTMTNLPGKTTTGGTDNKTPTSTRQSSRVQSPSLSKSSSKSNMSQKEMKTDKSEVKPGVMVNVSVPCLLHVCVSERERERVHECVFVLGVCRVCVSVCAFAHKCSLSPACVCVCV